MQLDLEGFSLEDKAILRLKEFEPSEGYYLAFSGGKDSEVLYDLAVKSGVKFDAHYMAGGIDPPELMQFIKENYPKVIWDKAEIPFWKAFQQHGLPSRWRRWCCEYIKEFGGRGRTVLTGIRWQESYKRRQRKMTQACTRLNIMYINPIIEWSSDDVWTYIKENHLPYCSLYDEGRKRLGCMMCPMADPKEIKRDMERWPQFAEKYKREAERYYNNKIAGRDGEWKSFDDLWEWWLRQHKKEISDYQCVMFLGDN